MVNKGSSFADFVKIPSIYMHYVYVCADQSLPHLWAAITFKLNLILL